MRNKHRGVLAAMLVIGAFSSAWAETAITVEDRAQIGEIYSLERLKKYTEAMPKIQVLMQRYPDNKEVQSAYMRVAGFGGDWKEADRVFDRMCVSGCDKQTIITFGYILESQGPNPDTLERMKELIDEHPRIGRLQTIYADMDRWSKQPPTSAAGAAVKALPDEEAAQLDKARTLSWNGQLSESTQIYQGLIKEHPDQVLYYRECARVFGWQGRYWAASNVYKQAARRFPDDKILQAEAAAKEASYDNLYWRARFGYKQWLELEPGNPEALFDLGQIYARSGRYAAAEKDYDELLAKLPDSVQAKQARDKADLYAHGWLTEAGVEHHESDGSTRQADVRLNDAFQQMQKSLLGNMMFGIKSQEMEYSFSDISTIHRQRYGATLEQGFAPDTYWRAGYGFSKSSDGIKDLQYRNAELQFPVITERVLLNASYNRDDFIQNSTTMLSHLQADQYRGRVTFNPIHFLEIGADGARSEITDGNRMDAYGGDAALHLSSDPRRLTLRYRWQTWRYQEQRPEYFSPNNFISKRVGLEWQYSFNKKALFWGANQLWYSFRYEYIMDPNNVRGHLGAVGVNWDLNKRTTLRLQWQHIYYEHPGIYKDDWLTAGLSFAF